MHHQQAKPEKSNQPQTPPRLETVAKEMRKKYADSGRKPATDEEINNARDAFYKNGGKL
jgi:hypothetical protein